MYKNRKVTICLPCRNEGKHLSKVIANIPPYVDEIIVVSNDSTDSTVKIAKKLGVKVIEDNRTVGGIGYGFAHMTGIKNASGDIIVGTDGDTTYPLESLHEALDYLLTQKLDFVSCSRYPIRGGTKIPLKLRLGVGLLNFEVRILYGKKVNDILSGMWMFRKEIKEQLQLTMGDWNLSPQIKLNALTNSAIAFGEYGIEQYQRHGVSHQKYFKTGFKHATWILKNRLTLSTAHITAFASNKTK